jgi:isoleucyl-tRNA synthetase
MSDGEAAGDYKDTLNLPKTDFPMKGNLQTLEPKMLQYWEEKDIYGEILKRNEGRPKFVLHDGPPYANGKLHAGHALNKILKDIITKYQNLSGNLCDFIPGWDCHGLPIEQAVEKRLRDKKVDKRTLSREQLLEACRQYALEFIDVQRTQFKRMGVMGRWEEPYTTLSFDYEAEEIRRLARFAENGYLYRRKKPVYWCIADQTALAEAEVEYEDHQSPSIYVAFDAEGDLSSKWPTLLGKRVAFAIWTTTPWTLPANLAISVHPEFDYVFYDLGERVVVAAKELLPAVLSAIAPAHLVPASGTAPASLAAPARLLQSVKGAELSGLRGRHPLYPRPSPIVLGTHVTLEQGTGLVHTAPGHGLEDYQMGLQYGLDIYNPVKNDGRYDESVGPELAGKKVFDANPLVVGMLAQNGALLNPSGDQLSHSYPHCWRCHNPVIFRATHQWFISLEKNELRKKALEEIDRTKWIPKWGRERIYSMLENRPDWCISRQRVWGVPIAVALCEGCDEALLSAEMMEKVAQAVEKEGVAVWYREPVETFLPKGAVCPGCGGSKFRRETDILDVWFDSACSYAAVAQKRKTLGYPVDMYLEGSDQHRGWFHSSLLVGVGTDGRAPYKSCLTHGFVVDGNGEKMSKSKGNTVGPEEIIKEYGAEVLRLWVASSDYRDDVRLSKQILKGLSEGYRKIRNTLRYALSNLYDFAPADQAVPYEQLLPLDKWAFARLDGLVARVQAAYEACEFHLVFHAVVDFCAMDLSALYFDILKDRLYTSKAGGLERRSAQTVLFRAAMDLLRIVAPVMSFTAEEAWQKMPAPPSSSVFLAGFPKRMGPGEAELEARYARLFAVRSEVQKLLEAARRDKQIGASLEAKVILSADGELGPFIRKHLDELPSLFIVSQVEWAQDTEGLMPLSAQSVGLPGKLSAKVSAADGEKCPRCWTYSTEVGRGGEVCAKCRKALS